MRPSRAALVALLLAALQAVLLARTAWDKSDVIDEDLYLQRSIQIMQPDQPAMPRSWLAPQWAYAAALVLADPEGGAWPRKGRPWPPEIGPERVRRIVFATRVPTLVGTVLAGLLLWSACRRFGDRAALVTHLAWCLSPTVLAHGALVTMDPWLAIFGCALLWTVVRALEVPSAWRVAATAAVFALGVSSKLPFVIAAPVLGVLLVVIAMRAAREQSRPFPGTAVRLGAVWLAAFAGSVFAIYGFTIGPLDQRVLAEFGAPRVDLGPLPFPGFIENLMTQVAFGSLGHQNYLFGEVNKTGWWWFYLAAVALKTTLGAQALALVALAATLARRPTRENLRIDAALLAFPALLFLVLSAGSAQGGIRYLLPAYPFVLAWLGRGAARAMDTFGGAGRAAVAAALAVSVVGSLTVHPHHLMFFNAWAGGPAGGPRYLVTSDDWGQDQRRLAEWVDTHGVRGLRYTYYSGHPEAWGLRYGEIESCEPTKGVFALHAVEVHRPRRIDEGCLDWLTREPPDERIGWSIYVYVVDKDRLARLRNPDPSVKPFWSSALRP
jgi:hypothetical protein